MSYYIDPLTGYTIIVSDNYDLAMASDVESSSLELSETADHISQTAEDVSNAVQEIASGASQQADEIQTASENVGFIGDAVVDVQESASSLKSIAEELNKEISFFK